MPPLEVILFWIYLALVSVIGGSVIGFVSAAMLHVLLTAELPYKIIAGLILILLLGNPNSAGTFCQSRINTNPDKVYTVYSSPRPVFL